ncbi:MAG TPA: chemotaxis response regulator protein-glutamate methylesterase [Fimbriimonas sp.]|nr:chemotaxis response regulator protein-glutamate methylesterase [Fimbriimonas sp.]
MIKVLVVDDSALMRKMVTDMLNSFSDVEVIGQARDGQDAIAKIESLKPDVVTMDIEMPVMDGITALERVMATHPTPVIMLSSLTQAGASSTIKCLELGAVDFVGKPSGSISLDIEQVKSDLYLKVRAASKAKLSVLSTAKRPFIAAEMALGRTPSVSTNPSRSTTHRGLLFIGSSTGGPKALHAVLPYLHANLGVPIVIVQHLPEGFTGMLASRLNQECPFEVREAKEGDILKPGTALIAPGGKHLKFDTKGVATFGTEPPVNGVKPAIDITLTSLVPLYGRNMVGVILTGMGKDGAASMKLLSEKNGVTLAESEETCVVYGMPKAAFELGAVSKMVRLEKMAEEIRKSVNLIHPSNQDTKLGDVA